ncbi:MAG: hypothetical protein HQM10_25250 [Candidatus Riflebacteria bacterium]|nr:hypothetical protein [Candidatus Riflebacteria bacterium]
MSAGSKLFLILALMGVLFSSSSVYAVSPAFKMPEWYKYRTSVSSAENGKIAINLEVSAPIADIKDFFAKIHVKKANFSESPQATVPLIKKGTKYSKVFSFELPSDYYGWIDFEITSVPDNVQFKSYVDNSDKLSTETRLLLNAEIKNIQKPHNSGFSIPLTVTGAVTELVTPELLFTQVNSNLKKSLFVWAPEGQLGSGKLKDLYSEYLKALNEKNLKLALELCVKIEKNLPHSEKSITFSGKSNTESFLNKEIIVDILRANREILLSAINPEAGIKRMEKLLQNSAESYYKPFISVNAAVMYFEKNLISEAVALLKKTAENHSGFSMIKKLIKDMEK